MVGKKTEVGSLSAPASKIRDVDSNRDAKKEYLERHIPGAMFWDVDEHSDKNSSYPHMISDSNYWTKMLLSFGITNHDHIIVYDHSHLYSACRLWFVLRYFGHKKVSILNGGFKSWKEDWDNDTEAGFALPEKKTYKSTINKDILANKDDVLEVINKSGYLIDARPSAMYMGINTSLPAVRSGTIPQAVNIPNEWMLVNGSLFFQDKVNLEKIFEYLGIFSKDGQISFCNAGLESALSWFVMSEILEFPNNKLYESSLAEWSKDSSLPMIDIINFSKNKSGEKEIDSFSMKPEE